MRLPHASPAAFTKIATLGAILLFLPDARAGVAWGDASLKSDDVRVEIDPLGHAEVTHVVGLHVAAKKFRAFVIEGIDPVIEPPSDEATLAGRDGPGWPIVATDGKGQPVEAFLEPAGAAGRMRVRFGPEGVGRGDFTVRIRYRVDLARHGTLVREGAMAKLAWATPRWPEGYDGAHFVIALPAAPTEPRLSFADAEGDGEHSPDGVALVAIHRSATTDEIEITRPHVPQGESTKFVVRVDPKAFPSVAGLEDKTATRDDGIAHASSSRGKGLLAGCAALLAFGLGLALRRRDDDVDGQGFRPLVPIGKLARAALYGGAAGVGAAATFGGRPLVGLAATIVAMVSATLRAPAPSPSARTPGRWLAIPKQGVPARRVRPAFLFDVGTTRGAAIAIAVGVVAIAGALFAARTEWRAAVATLVVASVLVPLFACGRSAQLPPDLVADAWSVLAKIAAALEAKKLAPKIVAHTAATVDELRLRLDGTRSGVRSVEIGCAMVHASGGTALVPEVLVRVADGTAAARAAAAYERAHDDAVLLLGRAEGERVLSLRPADVAPDAIARIAALGLGLGAAPASDSVGAARDVSQHANGEALTAVLRAP